MSTHDEREQKVSLEEDIEDMQRINIASNEKVLAGVSPRVVDVIIACDPQYRRHRSDGTIVFEGDDGEFTATVEEYLADHEIGLDEVFYATVDVFLSDVKGTTIVTTGDTVDMLLDLRRLFQRYREDRKNAFSTLCRSFLPENLSSV